MLISPPPTKADPVFLCDACSMPSDRQFYLGVIGTNGICARCGGLAEQVYDDGVNRPQIAQWGEMEFSTAIEVLVYRPVIWDVNGYYRALGVGPSATREQLRRAYQAAEGWEDERLTYIIKVLLNPDQRAEYDSLQPGELFFDIFIRRAVERQLHDLQAQMADLYDEPSDEGYERNAKSIREDLDERMNKKQVLDKPAYSDEDAPRSSWGWGYYRWRSTSIDTDKLARWQALLVKACYDEGVQTRLSVGFAGSHLVMPWGLLPMGHRTVVFLRDGTEPTPELAAEVARLIRDRRIA